MYALVAIDSSGPCLIGDGYPDKGAVRRAWSTCRAAAIVAEGAVLEFKPSTHGSQQGPLRRLVAELARTASVIIAAAPIEEPPPVVVAEELPVKIDPRPTCAIDGCTEPRARAQERTHPVIKSLCSRDRKRAHDAVQQGRATEDDVVAYLNAGPHRTAQGVVKAPRSAKAPKTKPAAKVTKPRRATTPQSGDPLDLVRRLSAVVRQLGGVEATERLAGLVERAGGAERAAEMLDVALGLVA